MEVAGEVAEGAGAEAGEAGVAAREQNKTTVNATRAAEAGGNGGANKQTANRG